MTQLLSQISNLLVLAAISMLPLQHVFAASCCCHRDVNQGTAESTSFGRYSGSACCQSVESNRKNCDVDSSSSGATPCHCPLGWCGKRALDVLQPATVELSPDNAVDYVPPQSAMLIEFGKCAEDSAHVLADLPHCSALVVCIRHCRFLL